MKLNHLNLTVTDVQAARTFLETYFGLRGLDGFPGDDNFTLLFDESGFALSLMKLGEQHAVKYPGNFHIGFIQESNERVNEINQRLKEDGYRVPTPKHFHGSWTFYMQAPGGFTVEVLCSRQSRLLNRITVAPLEASGVLFWQQFWPSSPGTWGATLSTDSVRISVQSVPRIR